MAQDNFFTLCQLYLVEAFKFFEEVVSIEHSFDVVRTNIPFDKVSESQVLPIHSNSLWARVKFFSGAGSASEYNTDLAASHVNVLVLVNLSTSTLLCIAHETSYTK